MGHKAGAEFFDEKRPWSRRKDQILAYYLTPYLAKIATRRRPIVIVDAFAGPGRFKSGDAGSPLIIAARIEALRAKSPNTDCTEICIEPDPVLFASLQTNLAPHPFARAVRGSFLNFLPTLEGLARTSSVFIYADPFAIAGLEWNAMDRVFRVIDEGQSVELLLNFNAQAFVRRARAALKFAPAMGDPGDSGDDDASAKNVPTHTLDSVVGDKWWRTVVRRDADFAADVEAVAERMRRQLQVRFGEAGMYPMRVRLTDLVPKYFLIFASGHADGLRLISEAMHSDLAAEVEKVSTKQLRLFGDSPEELPSSERILRPAILKLLQDGMTRHLFSQFDEKSIRYEIAESRRAGRLRAEPDSPRLNDESRLFRVED